MKLRIGSGIDFHQLVEGRDLFIGGIKIPHTKGALGHSDAEIWPSPTTTTRAAPCRHMF